MSIEAMKLALEALEQHATPLLNHEDAYAASLTSLRQAIEEAEKEEPVAWATREDFYRELDRSVNRMRQQMEIKAVLMRCKNYDLALPIIDIREGYVLVGQVTHPEREWVGLTEEEMHQAANAMDAEPLAEGWKELIKFARAIEAKLREKNNG